MKTGRNYYRYELKYGNKVVYIGITNNPNRREAEHNNDGKKFTRFSIIGPAVTQDSADSWEESRLATYCKNHGGNTPKYNKKINVRVQ